MNQHYRDTIHRFGLQSCASKEFIKRTLQIITGHKDGKIKIKRDEEKFDTLFKDKLFVPSEDDSFVLCLMSHGRENVVLGIQACRGDDTLCTDSVATYPANFFFSFSTFIGHAAFRGTGHGM